MDSTDDDDFGELYVDVKVPASALVAGDVGFVKSCEESISDQIRVFEGTLNPESQGEMKKLDVVAAKDSSPCVVASAVNLNEESEYSDSDDDLNIVLEEDDSKKLACVSNSNNGGYVEPSRTCSFKKRRIGNWCTMPNAGMVNTWSRVTFDVNSDVFEKKPWRNPGMDISDFFNFGFNEQSWKDYCKPLLKGSAIEVGGETLERIPSADLHRPRDSDPDVVIQIPVTNDFEELSSAIPVEARSRSVILNEASRSGDSIKEEAFVECQENTASSSGEQSPPKVTPCDEEMVDEEKEDICYNSDETDTYSVERESSLGDQIRFSPTPSCSCGKSEEFENFETESSKGSDSDVQRKVITPPRRTRFIEDEANNIKSEERSGTKHSIRRRSHEDPRERRFRRINYAGHRRIKHGIVRGNGFPHANREKSHGRFYSSVVHDRHRGHRFGWHKSSRGRGLDHSNGYKHEVRLKEYTSHSSFNLNQGNSRSNFEEDEDRYGRQHCERIHAHERSHVLPNERNRYDWLRGPFHDQDRIPDTDYRYRLEYSSAHGRHNPKQSHENDLYCRRRGDYEYDFHRHREESGIPSELAYREMHSFAEVGRREFRGYERNEEFSEIDRRHHYTPDWYNDRFVSEKDGYKYRVQDHWPSPSLPMRDSWYTKGSRGDFWRDDTRDFTPSEAYKAGPRDGWTRNLVHKDNVSVQDRLTYDDDEWVRRDRRRYESADDIPCSMREVTYSEHPSYTDEIVTRDIRMPTRNRMPANQRSGYFKSNVRETSERHHISKKLRRDGHERQDPVNLTGRQGKLSNKSKRRFSNGGGDTIEQQEGEKPGKVLCRSSNEKATQIQDLNDKEEGEIIEEAKNLKGIEMDEARMRASMKKMEKRRERFKETQVAKPVVAIESQTEPEAKTDYTDQQRPVRKRRWCESLGVLLNQ